MSLVALIKASDQYRNSEFKELSLVALEMRLGELLDKQTAFKTGNHWTVAMLQVCLELGIKKMNPQDVEDCLEDINHDFSDDFFELAQDNMAKP